MTVKNTNKYYRPFIAALLSSLFCGFGHIYLKNTLKGLILFMVFISALGILWMSVSSKEFKILTWGDKQLTFFPSQRTFDIFGLKILAADIMKVTGTIQLLFTWFYSIIDAWKEGKRINF